MEEVIARIRTAFADTPRPEEGDVFRSNMLPGDRIKAAVIFLERAREAITLDQVRYEGDLIFFMHPAAFVYFLPRLMELCMASPREAIDLHDKLDFMFLAERRTVDYAAGYYAELQGLLDDAKREAIKAFQATYFALYPGAGPAGPYWV